MEINPWGILIGSLLFYAIGFIVCMMVIGVLQALKIAKIKSTSGLIGWSLAASLVLTIIFWKIKCSI